MITGPVKLSPVTANLMKNSLLLPYPYAVLENASAGGQKASEPPLNDSAAGPGRVALSLPVLINLLVISAGFILTAALHRLIRL